MDAIAAFKQRVQEDAALQAELRAIQSGGGEDSLAKVANIASAAGFDFTLEDLVQHAGKLRADATELSDHDLDRVAGGDRTSHGLSEAPFQIFYDFLFRQNR